MREARLKKKEIKAGKIYSPVGNLAKRAKQQQHPFNGPLSRVKPIWILLKQKTATGWQWHQLDHMQDCTSLQT